MSKLTIMAPGNFSINVDMSSSLLFSPFSTCFSLNASMAHLVELLNRQSLRMTDRVSSGLQLSLQGQNILYIQAFDDARRQELANILEKEKWKG